MAATVTHDQMAARTHASLMTHDWPLGGTPFLTAELGGTPEAPTSVMVELGFGIDLATDPSTWVLTDITGDVRMQSGISISSVGRENEQGQGNPAQLALVLDNDLGDYTPRKIDGKYWPNLKVGIPLRLGLNVGGGYQELLTVFISGIEPGWDMSGQLRTAAITAAGLLRRLQAGKTPVRSPLHQSITAGHVYSAGTGLPAAPAAYYTLEDEQGSDRAASALGGGPDMVVSGTVAFAGQAGPAGSKPLPNLSGGRLTVTGLPMDGFTDSWRTEFSLRYGSALANVNRAVVLATTGGVVRWQINAAAAGAGGIQLTYTRANGATTTVTSGLAVDDGLWHWIQLDAQQAGTDVAWFLTVDNEIAVNGLITSATLGPVQSGQINADLDAIAVSAGHLVTWSPFFASVDTRQAFAGYVGEFPHTRFSRVCADLGIPATVIGTSDMPMGSQPVTTVVDVIRECEAACDGLLYDGVGFGLGLVTGPSRYNAPVTLTLDIAAGHLSKPLAPVEDDQKIVNDVTFSRNGGSSAHVVQPTGRPRAPQGPGGIGTYDRNVQANLADDTRNRHWASWALHKGTVDEDRYAEIPLDLAAAPSLVDAWLAASAGKVGFRLAVTNLPAQGPTEDVDQFCEGWSSYLDEFNWTAALNNSPASPYRVFVVEDLQLGRLGYDGQYLDGDVNTTDTTWMLASPTSTLLVTSTAKPAVFPYLIVCDGEVVRVTATTGTASPQTVTVVRAVNGIVKDHKAGAMPDIYRPGAFAL